MFVGFQFVISRCLIFALVLNSVYLTFDLFCYIFYDYSNLGIFRKAVTEGILSCI